MKFRFLLLSILSLFSIVAIQAQTCPMCTIDENVHPNTGSEDYGLFPESVTIQAGVDTTIVFQFLMPQTLDVSGISATVETVQILDIVDLPPNTSLDWICDQNMSTPSCFYEPQNYRYGCVTVCMNTLALPGVYTINVDVYGTGQAAGITQGQSLPIPLEVTVLPAEGNPFFAMNTNVGCDSVDLELEQTLPQQLIINPVTYNWVVGGDTINGETANFDVNGAADHEVELIETIEEFYISGASLTVTDNSCYCGDAEEVNWPIIGCTQAPDPYLVINAGNGTVNTSVQDDAGGPVSWSGLNIPITDLAISIQAWDDDAVSANDDLGGFLTSITSEPTEGTFNFSTSCTNGSYNISRRVQVINNYIDTVTIYNSSIIPIISNMNADTFCIGDSVTLESTIADSYQWYLDSNAIAGATNQMITVGEAGDYTVEVIDAGSICPSMSTMYTLTAGAVDIPMISAEEAGLVATNNTAYSIQWFSNGIPIPGANSDTLSDLTSGGPFTASYTSDLGCEALSPAFEICIAGTSSASDVTLSLGNEIEFTASDFILTNGNDIAWAVSTSTDGPITDMNSLQNAIDNGWVLPSNATNSLTLGCNDFDGGNGDYYMTPISAQIFEIDSVIYEPDVDPGCIPDASLCLEISGTDWAILKESLNFTFPDGSTVNIIEGLIPDDFPITLPDTILPDLLALLPSVLPDGLCFQLTDLYQGDPNGDWTVSAQNVGTGTLNVELLDIEAIVYADSCSLISEDQVTFIEGVTTSMAPGSTNSVTITIPPIPANFPTITPDCNVFGEATSFSVDCGTAIEDIFDIASFNLYPNPNNGQFTIDMDLLETKDVTLQIVDVTGRLVMNRIVPSVNGNYTETFDLKNNLTSGFYVFNVKVGDYQSQIKFIVQ